MRIGAFAETYGLKKSTIRYYTDIKLLIPNFSTAHPIYDEQCHNDMKDILKLKEMGLTIEDIQRVKVIERFSITHSEEDLCELRLIFDKVLLTHQKNYEFIKHQMNLIEKEIESLQVTSFKTLNGVPLSMINSLTCPKCHDAFNISQASIQRNYLNSGILTCGCDTSFKIIDGMLVSSNLFNRLTKKDYQTPYHITNEQMASVSKYGRATLDIMNTWDHSKGIVFVNADIDILLMNIHHCFRDDGLYFFCSSDYDSLSSLQSKFKTDEAKGHIIFILSDDDFPITDSVGYVLNNGSNIVDMLYKLDPGTTISQYKHFNHATWLNINITKDNASSKYLRPTTYHNLFRDLKLVEISSEKVCDIYVKQELMPTLSKDHILDVWLSIYKNETP